MINIPWESLSEEEIKRLLASADMSKMHLAPTELLAPYAILDCISTLQLFDDVLWPVLEEFPELEEFHRDYFVTAARLLWQQQFRGIILDRPGMEEHAQYLRDQMREAEVGMRSGPLGPGIAKMEADLLAELATKEPAKFLKRNISPEPAKLTKGGAVSKNWLKWRERADAPLDISKNWIKWRERMDDAESGTNQEFRFNPGSTKQLGQVLYAPNGPVNWRRTGRTRSKKQKEIEVFEIEGVHGWVELDGTEAGELPVNGDLYSQLPSELAKPLQLYADAEQELGYCVSYLERSRLHPDGKWRIHPGWRVPGTLTGRLSGAGGINLQQCPKTIDFLRCLIADDGEVWLEADASSLEPTVLAELTRDPSLMEVYGPAAKPHDIYLYNGAHYAVLRDEIGPKYDLQNVTTEMVKSAKKDLKRVREACKVCSLAKAYGAGAATIWRGLRLRGFEMTFNQAKELSDSHDSMYRVSGVEFRRLLEMEWEARGGWVLSGLGHPICVWDRKLRDATNRVIQNTGHKVHTIFFVMFHRALESSGIPHTGVVWDFHDQLIVSMPREFGDRACEIFQETVSKLNEYLDGAVPIKYGPKLCGDMAVAKEAEFQWRRTETD